MWKSDGHGSLIQMPKTMQEITAKTSMKPTVARVVSCTPNRLRLRVAYPNRQAKDMQRIVDALQRKDKDIQVKTNPAHGSITIKPNVQHEKNIKDIFAMLSDIGIVIGDITFDKSEAAAEVSNAVVDLNRRVGAATNNSVDLRFLFPLGLSVLAVRQLLAKGLQFEIIPWYVLAWYAFDSFLKLHATNQSQLRQE